MFGSAGTQYIFAGVILVTLVLVFYVLRKIRKVSTEFDNRIEIPSQKLTESKRKIKKKFGLPLNIKIQESSDDNNTEVWIYPEKIITFDKNGELKKII